MHPPLRSSNEHDTAAIRFVVPGEPKAKERARSRIVRTRDGRQFVSHYTPSQTRNEEAAVKIIAAAAMQGRPPLTGPIELKACFYRAVPSSWSAKKRAAALENRILPTARPDLDN